MKRMKKVYVASQLRGDIEVNLIKARKYCRFAVSKEVIPLAPHVMFHSFLDDKVQEERDIGMLLGIELLKSCDELWVFGEISVGVAAEIAEAERLNIPIYYFKENEIYDIR